MDRRWRFYGREAEMAQLRAAVLAPDFDLVALRGRHGAGKTWLLREVAYGLPEDRPLAWYPLNPGCSREDTASRLLHDLQEPREKSGIGLPAEKAAALPRDMTALLEQLLRDGVSVALDGAHYLMGVEAPGLAGLALEIGGLARKLRAERNPPPACPDLIRVSRGQAGVRRGTLVLSGLAHIRTKDLLDLLGPAVGVHMLLKPWPASTLLSVARARGWLDRPRRLALLRTALGGLPTDWYFFAREFRREYRPLIDFAACPDDGEWRLLFARWLIENVVEHLDRNTDVRARIEFPPENWRILDLLAEDEGKEIDTAAIHAAFPDVPEDRLDGWLAVMSEDLGLIGEVPAKGPGPGGKAVRRWRICDPRLRFWNDVLCDLTSDMERLLTGEWGLAERLRVLEKDALAQFRRDCGADWPDPGANGVRGKLSQSACPRPSAGSGQAAGRAGPWAAPVERRAFAFTVTAPGVLEGVLVPYGVPIRIGDGFEEVFEPGSLTVNGLLVNVRQPVPADPPLVRESLPRTRSGGRRGPGQALPLDRPLARPGQGLELHDGPDAMRATVTLPDTIDGRRVRDRVEAGELTAFSAAFQALEEEWPGPDRRIVRRALLVGLSLAGRS